MHLSVPHLPTAVAGEDVLIGSLCMRQADPAVPGGQALFPLAARAVVVPASTGEPDWRASLQFPLATLPGGPGCKGLPLEMLLVHQRSAGVASLLRLLARCSSGASSDGGKEVTCTLTACAAFKWVPSGAQVLYCQLRPDEPLLPGGMLVTVSARRQH